MSTTAMNTAGTPEGVILESEGRLSRRERQACNYALHTGVLVKLEGYDEYGGFEDQWARLRPSNHPDIGARRTAYSKELARAAWGPNWKKKLQAKNVPSLPNGGETLLRIEDALFSITGWRGSLQNKDDAVVDLTPMDGEAVRAFIRENYLPPWRLHESQVHLPEYDSDAVDVAFLEMIENATDSLGSVDFFALSRHLKSPETSGRPFEFSPFASSGSPSVAAQGRAS